MPPHLLDIRRIAPGSFELAGELDIETIEEFEEAFDEFAEADGDVSFDVAGLTFIDSTGVRGFLALAQRLGGRSIKVRGARANVRRTLAISGIDGHGGIRIVPDAD